ncbi:MAG TPA: Pr6Pr family membrane protein, partial [Phytomonospora sp.]
GAVALLRGRAETPGLSSLRGAAATYLITTGVIFEVLLSDLVADLDTPGYVNVIMHQVLPVAMLLDWLVSPPANRLGAKDAAGWLIYPLAYAAYTLIRGPVVDWYPYPFIDPREKGYGHVAVMCGGITVWFVALAAALTWSGNLLRRRARPSERPLPTSPGR